MTDKTFINGMLAEKAKLANTLIAEILAEIPDELLQDNQKGLQAGADALQHVYNDLRTSCK